MDSGISQKHLGYLLIFFGIVLLAVLGIVKTDYDSQAALLCTQIEASGTDMLQCPAHNSNASWYFLLGFGIGFILVAFGFYLSFVPKPVSKKSFKEINLSSLDSDSLKVYNFLKSKNGAVFQSDLINETGYSKVKISRILDKMEMDEVVERKRRGMANLIVLR